MFWVCSTTAVSTKFCWRRNIKVKYVVWRMNFTTSSTCINDCCFI
ncbi:organic hydroperoxide resistance protein-like 2 [Listeria monocytogenes]|nr:organic hydroperoxide resistance protein-like 2 [Listeria monocytogenes]